MATPFGAFPGTALAALISGGAIAVILCPVLLCPAYLSFRGHEPDPGDADDTPDFVAHSFHLDGCYRRSRTERCLSRAPCSYGIYSLMFPLRVPWNRFRGCKAWQLNACARPSNAMRFCRKNLLLQYLIVGRNIGMGAKNKSSLSTIGSILYCLPSSGLATSRFFQKMTAIRKS